VRFQIFIRWPGSDVGYKEEASMDRPTGVTILAVLNFIGAAILIIVGLLFMLGIGMAGGAVDSAGGMGVLVTLGAVGGVILIVLGVIAGVIGIGLWKLANWARIVTIVCAVIGILGAVVGMIGGNIFSNLITLAIDGVILWYLFQSNVKEAFGVS
jgi:hypothetical protein